MNETAPAESTSILDSILEVLPKELHGDVWKVCNIISDRMCNIFMGLGCKKVTTSTEDVHVWDFFFYTYSSDDQTLIEELVPDALVTSIGPDYVMIKASNLVEAYIVLFELAKTATGE